MRILGSVYLDHAGTTLYPKSLMERFAIEMTSSLLGNPHSASPSSQLATSRIEDTRLRALQFFQADPNEFDLIFVANATAGIKLVAETLRAAPDGFDYVYHEASHTSLVGVREEARNSICMRDDEVEAWFDGQHALVLTQQRSPIVLFAYPAQSNMNGTRYPLDWLHRSRNIGQPTPPSVLTLLDAAALAATCPLDLSDSATAPDFTVVSFSKIFGFPDLGALIVRRQAEPAFAFRKYFGGGTVDTVVCHKESWHAPKSYRLHERLEDGTLPVHSIIALDIAMSVHEKLFGPMVNVASHVSYLARRLYVGLRGLLHSNGVPVCEIYSPDDTDSTKPSILRAQSGPVIAFNIRNQVGAWLSLAEVEKLASLKCFHIRAGGVCNPGGIASALNLEPWELKRNFSAGFRCGDENDIIAGKPTGVIRASLGAMSTISDVDAFIAFISEFYCEKSLPIEIPSAVVAFEKLHHNVHVADITVYPIKSCGGFTVPRDADWEVRPEGLAWDREWCLLHQGTGQALSQKRYPNMALIRPVLDFKTGVLRISYGGDVPARNQPKEISVPLSSNPVMFRKIPLSLCRRPQPSRVCGDEIIAQTYSSEDTNDFFSAVLGVSCVLARFPPGGQEGEKSTRHAKAHLQKHQKIYHATTDISNLGKCISPNASVTPPSPPDSDAEDRERRRILLANESPILAINLASLRALNREIVWRGGTAVSPAVFRANIVLDSGDGNGELAYSEDNWSELQIGQQIFKMLGSCRRCHMVCVNQETAVKGQEPFVTLSKTRRFDGKVFFGTHMCHVPVSGEMATRETQNPTIRIGDTVLVK